MKRLLLRDSLSFRLSLSLGIATAIFWLGSATIALSFEFRDSRKLYLRHLDAEIASHVARQRIELQNIQNDLRILLRSWKMLPDGHSENRRYLVARYVEEKTSRKGNQDLIDRAKLFVETYGNSGIEKFVNTFVLFNQGYAIAGADSVSECCTGTDTQDRRNITELRQLLAKDELIWGEPYRTVGGEWHVPVGSMDARTGAIVGITVKLSSSFFPQAHLDVMNDASFIWLDEQGKQLTPSPELVPLDLARALSRCDGTHPQSAGEMQVNCTTLTSTGWRMVYIYPSVLLRELAWKNLEVCLLVTAISFILSILLIYIILWTRLGRPLAIFIQSIRTQDLVDEQLRLPQERNDELGHFAQAYNGLLDAVQTKNGMLEARVKERTFELDEAKCRAERASRNKSDQLTSITHEIRTPLNGLVGALTLLNTTICDRYQRSLIDTAQKCADHLLEIINNLLDFSRIESGYVLLTQRELDPFVLIDEAMLNVQLPALRKSLTLRVELASSFPPLLITDGLRLRQILINLLGNAVKFTGQGSVTLQAWRADGKIYFSVRDTGSGVPAEWWDEVFVPFKQFDSHVVGSGLGLTIARSLAQLLGGDLYLVPVDSGACFQLELPYEGGNLQLVSDRGEITAPASLHSQLRIWGFRPVVGDNEALSAPELVYLPAKLRQRLLLDSTSNDNPLDGEIPMSAWALKVLIVDDVETNREIVGQMIRLQGHQVWEAASGEAALVLGCSHVFDLVLTDVRMPSLSGIDTILLWRDEASAMLDSDCPIIAISANAQPGERERLLQAGFNEYLTKPLTLPMLARALDLAADLQLVRGMELAANVQCGKPMLIADKARSSCIGNELQHSYQLLREALSAQDRESYIAMLHRLKGVAGQAGLRALCESIEDLENGLSRTGMMQKSVQEVVMRLIEVEIEMFARSELSEEVIS
ncbi:two component system sensor kinase [Caballeronia sp. EK]|uniref:two component system sensor kinase n=1 Tax=Caballeronia sp. EK TaxID=2767469 RepID=UPI001655FFAE|nr:two component system sensor kinase [Caballeronia sp. EK]MBC8642794.1 two component system sensor kinase [Caballeronia sp. EK]